MTPLSQEEVESLSGAMRQLFLDMDQFRLAEAHLQERSLTCGQAGALVGVVRTGLIQRMLMLEVVLPRLSDLPDGLPEALAPLPEHIQKDVARDVGRQARSGLTPCRVAATNSWKCRWLFERGVAAAAPAAEGASISAASATLAAASGMASSRDGNGASGAGIAAVESEGLGAAALIAEAPSLEVERLSTAAAVVAERHTPSLEVAAESAGAPSPSAAVSTAPDVEELGAPTVMAEAPGLEVQIEAAAVVAERRTPSLEMAAESAGAPSSPAAAVSTAPDVEELGAPAVMAQSPSLEVQIEAACSSAAIAMADGQARTPSPELAVESAGAPGPPDVVGSAGGGAAIAPTSEAAAGSSSAAAAATAEEDDVRWSGEPEAGSGAADDASDLGRAAEAGSVVEGSTAAVAVAPSSHLARGAEVTSEFGRPEEPASFQRSSDARHPQELHECSPAVPAESSDGASGGACDDAALRWAQLEERPSAPAAGRVASDSQITSDDPASQLAQLEARPSAPAASAQLPGRVASDSEIPCIPLDTATLETATHPAGEQMRIPLETPTQQSGGGQAACGGFQAELQGRQLHDAPLPSPKSAVSSIPLDAPGCPEPPELQLHGPLAVDEMPFSAASSVTVIPDVPIDPQGRQADGGAPDSWPQQPQPTGQQACDEPMRGASAISVIPLVEPARPPKKVTAYSSHPSRGSSIASLPTADDDDGVTRGISTTSTARMPLHTAAHSVPDDVIRGISTVSTIPLPHAVNTQPPHAMEDKFGISNAWVSKRTLGQVAELEHPR